MHGGAKGSGGPRGKRNGNFRHGLCTREAKAILANMRATLREIKALNEFGRSARGRRSKRACGKGTTARASFAPRAPSSEQPASAPLAHLLD